MRCAIVVLLCGGHQSSKDIFYIYSKCKIKQFACPACNVQKYDHVFSHWAGPDQTVNAFFMYHYCHHLKLISPIQLGKKHHYSTNILLTLYFVFLLPLSKDLSDGKGTTWWNFLPIKIWITYQLVIAM